MRLTTPTKIIGCLLIGVCFYSAVSNSVRNNYGSLFEAEKACKSWVKVGGTEEYSVPPLYGSGGPITRTRNLRGCRHEKETNQILGLGPNSSVEEYFTY